MKNIFSYSIFVAILLGLFLPINVEYKILIPYLLAIILFFSFLKLEYKLRHFFRKELIYYFLIGILIIPFIVFYLTKNLESNLRLGLFLVSITPTAIGSPLIVDIIKGSKELIVSNVVIYNLLSPLTYSVLLKLYFGTSDLILPINLIIIKLSIMIFIPFIISLIIRKYINIKKKLLDISKYLSPLALVFVIYIAVSSASYNLKSLSVNNLLIISLIVFILTISSFLIGYFLSSNTKIKKTLSVVFGHKNSALTTWIAISNFSPIVVIPMILYLIFHHIINGFLIHKWN